MMTLFPKDFDKFFVGFDDQFSRLTKMHDDLTKNVPNYPFYDIVKTDENKYEIRLAVAGFGQQDIEVELVFLLDTSALCILKPTKSVVVADLYVSNIA